MKIIHTLITCCACISGISLNANLISTLNISVDPELVQSYSPPYSVTFPAFANIPSLTKDSLSQSTVLGSPWVLEEGMPFRIEFKLPENTQLQIIRSDGLQQFGVLMNMQDDITLFEETAFQLEYLNTHAANKITVSAQARKAINNDAVVSISSSDSIATGFSFDTIVLEGIMPESGTESTFLITSVLLSISWTLIGADDSALVEYIQIPEPGVCGMVLALCMLIVLSFERRGRIRN